MVIPQYNVFYYNMNKKTIETVNVIKYMLPFIKKLRQTDMTRDEFDREVKSEVMYEFWSKAEWEIIISGWCGDGNEETKIDVYDQIIANWEVFSNICWRIYLGRGNNNG